MRRYIIVVAVAALVAGIAVAAFENGKTPTAKTDEILTVNDIQAAPRPYKGTITVTGVVAKISKDDPGLFAIVDTTEARECRSVGCAEFYFPIRYGNELPKEWDEIRATGNIVRKDGLVFEATRVDIVSHLAFDEK